MALDTSAHIIYMKSTRKRLRKNKPSSSSEPSSESDPEFVEILQSDNSAVAETSDKPTHEHGVQLPISKRHVVSQKRKCWVFYPVHRKSTSRLCQKGFTCTDGKMKLTTSTLKVHLLKAHNTNTEVRAAYLFVKAEKWSEELLAKGS